MAEIIFQGPNFSVVQMPVNMCLLIEQAKAAGNDLFLRRIQASGRWAVSDQEIEDAAKTFRQLNARGGTNNNQRFKKT